MVTVAFFAFNRLIKRMTGQENDQFKIKTPKVKT